ncbi:hypothetical protein PHYSODRAFT_263490 [Phytophthora sojae]|uniref:Uncharacterized protein n=1 Tax=Phytophthora sojae (strain P6497) TaxID=1094619 RepID=G4YPZ8_PHYSP|nr:hypothetical protein PHYSODRAFT_263490 [Phytophthora sojae]EGZ29313.1 hypothetical protein PHYSODRAFT_263490 [Phytophthora sojae]|eukprot:XP_009516588.1 hypothetical protein PHYSODRAFT_263490 [Phytophthora sojae]
MAPDGVFNTEYGPGPMVKSWCFSQWFDAVEVELTSLHKTTEDSVLAVTKTSVTITHRTLANVFSHLLSSVADRKLADKLAGQRIVMRGSTSFGWNNSIGRFSSVISQSDMVTPTLRLLWNLEDWF